MPHDRPSISATVVEADAIVTTDATAVMPINVVMTPMIAPMMGMPAAASAPNVIIKMMKAMIRPISSGNSEMGLFQPG